MIVRMISIEKQKQGEYWIGESKLILFYFILLAYIYIFVQFCALWKQNRRREGFCPFFGLIKTRLNFCAKFWIRLRRRKKREIICFFSRGQRNILLTRPDQYSCINYTLAFQSGF